MREPYAPRTTLLVAEWRETGTNLDGIVAAAELLVQKVAQPLAVRGCPDRYPVAVPGRFRPDSHYSRVPRHQGDLARLSASPFFRHAYSLSGCRAGQPRGSSTCPRGRDESAPR